MKCTYALLIIYFFTSISISSAQDKGIKFRNLTVPQAVAAAKKENKFVYVHGYADWCTHCKTMAETIYLDAEVAKLYNANFVNIKINMEKEGKDLAKKLRISSYPALLYIDGEGIVVHRAKGERKKAEFLVHGREAVDPKKNMKYLENAFNAGKSTREETYKYFRFLEMAGLDSQPKLNNYLSKLTVTQLQQPEYWRFIADLLKDHTLAISKVFMDNKKGFEAKFTADSVNNKIMGMYISDMMKRVQSLDSTGYHQIKMRLKNSKLDIAEKIISYADLTSYRMKGQWPEYIDAAPSFIDNHCATDARKLNETAQQFAERATKKEDLAMAEKWAKQSIKLNDIYKYNMTLASLQIKLQKQDDALKTAKHALEIGKKENADTKPALLLIDRLEK